MSHTRLSILIVDDDDQTRELLKEHLSAEFDVREAASGEDAMQAIEHQGPDVIIVDLAMPRMNGAEVIRRIKSGPARQHTAVVVLTGDTRQTHLQVAAAAGADSLLTKPVDLDILTAEIRSVSAALTARSYQRVP